MVQVLPAALQGLLGSLKFQKTMRWRGAPQFSRPLRWLLALHGQNVVPMTFGGLASGRTSRMLRMASRSEEQVCNECPQPGQSHRVIGLYSSDDNNLTRTDS